ncbi:potassium channel family protein [Natronomonas sp.]|uniref:potassium channel family protein n=1 Tax=Natronomonas sp. TaxID=2184060 RepID=UPI00261B8583|nr:NAD(P)-binding protein [Natronomonas sp.]
MDRHVLIVGAGRVGYRVADRLGTDRHAVTVIERDAERCVGLASNGTRVIEGDGTDPGVFDELNLAEVDIVAALTDDTETNLTVCERAREHAPDVRTVLRIAQDGEQDYGYRSFVDHVVYPAAAGAEVALEQITGQ